jgi:uncharacterized membrane protein YfcA
MYFPPLDRLARFMAGILGGPWLIVPLLVIAFDASLSKTAITVSVSVVFFALAVGLVFETDNKDILTATATYAAVLVALVGTSTSASLTPGVDLEIFKCELCIPTWEASDMCRLVAATLMEVY